MNRPGSEQSSQCNFKIQRAVKLVAADKMEGKLF